MSLSRLGDPIYGGLRLVAGLLFACHGAQKVLGWFLPPDRSPQPLDLLPRVAGWIEVLCGLLIAVGFVTRPAAFLASGTMAVAYFMVHANGGLLPIVNHGELAVLYCWLFLFIFFHGPGKLSIDGWIRTRSLTTDKRGE